MRSVSVVGDGEQLVRLVAETLRRQGFRVRRGPAGDLCLDLDRREARCAGRATALSRREAALLAYLMRRAGHVCTRAELLAGVWGMTSIRVATWSTCAYAGCEPSSTQAASAPYARSATSSGSPRHR